MIKAVFLDKDGTLVNDVPHNVNPDLIQLADGAGAALRLLRQHGYRLYVVSNQPGVARGLFDEAALLPVWHRLQMLLVPHQVALDGFYYCPHYALGPIGRYAVACNCRKPRPGMLLRAAQAHDINLPASWMVGDILHDIEAGRRAGCRTALIDNGNETEWDMSALRAPDIRMPNLHEAVLAMMEHDAISPFNTSMSNSCTERES